MKGPHTTAALIAAAGKGRRFGGKPKLFHNLKGRALISYVIEALSLACDRLYIAVPAGLIEKTHQLIDNECSSLLASIDLVEGGATRQETIERLLQASNGEKMLLIHDVSCPLIKAELAREVIARALASGAAATTIVLDSPVGTVHDGVITSIAATQREHLIRPPVAVLRRLLEDAYERADNLSLVSTSTVELLLSAGVNVSFVPAGRSSIKIVEPLDALLAERILEWSQCAGTER